MTRILYLHGFRSSPLSNKANIMRTRVHEARKAGAAINWFCPQLPNDPQQAFELGWDWVRKDMSSEPLAIIGSSLGGFYAAALTERLLRVGVYARCVLLNPAVHPACDLESHIGQQTGWHDQTVQFDFTMEHVQQLARIETSAFTRPERYMAIICTGDEVLKWQEMHERYPAGRMKLIDGSDHAISEFAQYADEVLAFCLDA